VSSYVDWTEKFVKWDEVMHKDFVNASNDTNRWRSACVAARRLEITVDGCKNLVALTVSFRLI
jgi:hypothetical protein